MQEQGKIPFMSAVLMNINVIVGVGIYAYPQMMVGKAGAMSFLGWTAGGLLLFPVVWNVALAARMFPGAGGFYNYCSQGLNQVWGFVAAWAYFLGFFATSAVQIMVLRNAIAQQFNLPVIISFAALFNLLFVLILAGLNTLEVGLISRIQSVATVLKIMPMIIVIATFWFFWNSTLNFDVSRTLDIGYTLPSAIFGYWGFESCCSISHLIKGGPTKASSVILTAFFIVAMLYTLFHFGVMHIMGADNLAQLGVLAFPQFMGISSQSILLSIKLTLGFVFLLAYFNAAYGVMLANITNLFSLAQKKMLFGSDLLVKENRYNRPVMAIALYASASWIIMTFIPNLETLTALANLGVSLALILTNIAVFRMQLKEKALLPIMVSCLSFISLSILTYFNWNSMGNVTSIRLLYITTFVVCVLAGLGMYYSKKNQ